MNVMVKAGSMRKKGASILTGMHVMVKAENGIESRMYDYAVGKAVTANGVYYCCKIGHRG